MSSLDFSDILRARQNLRGIIGQTPFVRSVTLSQQTNSEITFKRGRRLIDRMVLVEENEIRFAIRFLLEHHRLVVEGSGAVGIAALLHNRWSDPGRKVGVVLSGGNLDSKLLRQILTDFSGITK